MSLENLKLKFKFSVSSVQVEVILSTEYTLIEKIDSWMLKMMTFYDYVNKLVLCLLCRFISAPFSSKYSLKHPCCAFSHQSTLIFL